MKYLLELLRDLKSKVEEEAKNHPGYILLLVGVIVLLFVSLLFNSSNLILSLTALIVLYYTIETYKMRKAIADNTELNTRPILVLEIDFNNKKAYIKNFGNFPAYNLRFEDDHFEEIDKGFSIFSKIDDAFQTFPSLLKDLEPIDVIAPKDNIQILEEEYGIDFFTYLDPSNVFRGKTFSFETKVIYDDILNNTWQMNLGYSPGRLIATKPEKITRRSYVIKSKHEEKKGAELD